MRGWFRSICLAIGIITILSHAGTRAGNGPLFGPPPLSAARSSSLREDGAGASRTGFFSLKKAPLKSASAASPVREVSFAASQELPATVKPERPQTTSPTRSLPKPGPSAGYSTIEDKGWKAAVQPIAESGQAQASPVEPPVAKQAPPKPSAKTGPPVDKPARAKASPSKPPVARKAPPKPSAKTAQPVEDPGYSPAKPSKPPVAWQGPSESSSAEVFVCDAPAGYSCDATGCRSLDTCGCEDCRQCIPWTVPQLRRLDDLGIRFGGWIDQGITFAANKPTDRYNGVVTFNDRDSEYQMNQLWLYMEREVDECGCFDVGGRIDFVYGTDARFIQARDGLESDWGQNEPFYQVALPQAYVDVASHGWTLRAGRFLTVLGYESPMATENFFYSHSYAMQYGEPFTHLGLMGMRQVGHVSFTAGVHRGNDQFDDTDGLDALNVLGGISMTSCDERMTGAYAFTATEEGPNATSYIHSLVATLRLTDRLSYIIQGDYGQTWNEINRTEQAWTGIKQYMFYAINDCWSAGIRSEWFRDYDGSRVTGLGAGNLNTGPYSGDFYEITLGLNWSPHANLRIRPEARWDIFDPIGQPGNLGAFDAGDKNTQFVFGCDLICTF